MKKSIKVSWILRLKLSREWLGLEEQTNEPLADNSLEEEDEEERKTVEFDRTVDEIEAENLTKNQEIEQNVEEPHPAARFVGAFRLSYRTCFFVRIRPRRLSEMNIVENVKPIPPYSSLFIFPHTNK